GPGVHAVVRTDLVRRRKNLPVRRLLGFHGCSHVKEDGARRRAPVRRVGKRPEVQRESLARRGQRGRLAGDGAEARPGRAALKGKHGRPPFERGNYTHRVLSTTLQG